MSVRVIPHKHGTAYPFTVLNFIAEDIKLHLELHKKNKPTEKYFIGLRKRLCYSTSVAVNDVNLSTLRGYYNDSDALAKALAKAKARL